MKKSVSASSFFVAIGLASSGYSQTFNIIYSFTNPSAGADITGTPYIGPGGILYATSGAGGSGTACSGQCGTVFSLTPPVPPATTWTAATVYSFQGSDGEFPDSGVIAGANGTLLGTTLVGGSTVNFHCPAGCGVVFQLTPPGQQGGAWTNHVLYDLLVVDKNPHGLVMGSGGVLYAPAQYGGNEGGQVCDGLGCGSVMSWNLPPPAEAGQECQSISSQEAAAASFRTRPWCWAPREFSTARLKVKECTNGEGSSR